MIPEASKKDSWPTKWLEVLLFLAQVVFFHIPVIHVHVVFINVVILKDVVQILVFTSTDNLSSVSWCFC